MLTTALAPASCKVVRQRSGVRPFCAKPVQRRTFCKRQPASTAKLASRQVFCRAAEEVGGLQDVEKAQEAIDLGLNYCKNSQWTEALQCFEKALTLPGTGTKRYRDKPKLISDGEKAAALYNSACCFARLGDARSGLVALAGCLETGYADFNQVRADPDLEFLRADPRFEGLLARFEPPKSAFSFPNIFGGKK